MSTHDHCEQHVFEESVFEQSKLRLLELHAHVSQRLHGRTAAGAAISMSPADSTTSRNSTLSAPSHHGARTTAVHERDMVEFIKSMTPQKEPRDPRADPEQWPCHGNHIPGKGHSNAHGEWTHCAVCNYRLKYVPKKGSNSANTKVENAEMVRRMLTELQSLMRGCRPTAAICLSHAAEGECRGGCDGPHPLGDRPPEEADGHSGLCQGQSHYIQKTSQMATPPSPSTSSSWDLVTVGTSQSPLAQEMEEHLTQEERDQLKELLRKRRQQSSAAATPVPHQADVVQAYEGEMN